jgi:hypothetical protein
MEALIESLDPGRLPVTNPVSMSAFGDVAPSEATVSRISDETEIGGEGQQLRGGVRLRWPEHPVAARTHET